MAKFLHFIFFLFFVSTTFSIEPQAISLKKSGHIDWVYFDFRNQHSVYPLTGLYLNENGTVKYLRISLEGATVLMDQKGQTTFPLQGNFEVEWNNDNKVERIKRDYTTLYHFSYDSEGHLEYIKNESYDVMFRLSYNSGGQLDKIDQGSYNYLLRFDYDSSDRLDAIKNESYDYFWRIYYNSNGSLDEIKNNAFDQLAEVTYTNGEARSILKIRSTTQFLIGINQVDFLNGRFTENGGYGYCGTPAGNSFSQGGVVFFQHDNFQGDNLTYSSGSYGTMPFNWNDVISSIIVPPGYKVTFYEHENFSGESITIEGSWTVKSATEFWNDRISSFIITKF